MPKRSVDKEIIVKEAIEIANTEGIDKISLGEIAKRLGIKTPSIYNHVEGLPGLRKELALSGLRALRDTLLKASVGKSEDQAIISLGMAYAGFVRSNPGLYEASMANPDVSDTEIQLVSNEIVGLIVTILQGYRLDQKETIHIVRGLRSLLHGFAYLEMKNEFRMEVNTNDSLKKMIKTFIAGFKSKEQ